MLIHTYLLILYNGCLVFYVVGLSSLLMIIFFVTTFHYYLVANIVMHISLYVYMHPISISVEQKFSRTEILKIKLLGLRT